MKRLLSACLCIAMLLFAFPVLAETTASDPWVLSEVEGGRNVDSCTWSEGQTDMIIPLSVDGKPIVSYTSMKALTTGAPEGAVLLPPIGITFSDSNKNPDCKSTIL